ncbi:enamine deaminase RidA [Phyllobacterium phragmitis]|uniref:Enamine deaminase RidA n=1 Tax=Phyllobacterium phragmitis TaxID=2670329 RepID=A0A2S9IRB5_9HYPH|nr:RidA family protein [Phyllobacterium phragmitis]PRD43050.1 enamine deaminase RidA [Phyllobacterium phragmitis]
MIHQPGGRHIIPTIQFSSPQALPPTANYSHLAVVPEGARTIYISGQVPLDVNGVLIGKGDFEAQAVKVFENLEIALKEVGAGFGDLVKIGLYVTDMANLATLRRVRDQFIRVQSPPTSTLVQVAAFFSPDILFEMDAIAAVED